MESPAFSFAILVRSRPGWSVSVVLLPFKGEPGCVFARSLKRPAGADAPDMLPLRAQRDRSWHALAMSTDEVPDWQPDGWADWTYERRRIWRLERQLLRWEAFAFAARSFAHAQAAIVAELRGEATPTQADIDRIVFETARSRWKAADNAVDRARLLESDRASQLDDPDNWVGGFYELALELGPSDDERLEAAIRAVCTHTAAVGWYAVGGRRAVAEE